jgi:putrescine transport system ATP-binding protein
MADTSAPGASNDSFVRIDRLTKRFDDVAAVDNVSIDIAKGEIFALLGSSGCGKSTLLRMLAGFETPTEGAIYLEGQSVGAMEPFRRPINMMFQSYALFPHLTVWENIAFGLKRDGMPKAQIDERVEEMLKTVQLKKFVKRKPHQLSGGQQQRVALARALAKRPKLLLLDEPLGALDAKLREETQMELKNIIKQVGVTCVLVTHDQEEAMTMADRIAIMSEGRFRQVGSPSDIYETPNCRFVADFIGKVNLFDGILDEDEPDYCVISTPQGRFRIGHGITGTQGMKATVALRPEKVSLSCEAPSDADACNVFAGTIVTSGYYGSFSVLHVELANGKRIQVSEVHTDRHAERFVTGERVWAMCSPDSPVVLTN